MYLMDYKILVRQLLPPHWRGTYRERLCYAVVYPLEAIYRLLLGYRKAIIGRQNLGAQVGVMEYYLNKTYAESDYRYIELADGREGGQCVVLIHERYIHRREEVYRYLETMMPFGFTFIIESKT